MSIGIKIGETVPLSFLTPDGAADKYPIAIVYDQSNNVVSGSPFTLTHFANGRYVNNSLAATMSHVHLRAIYIIYEDNTHIVESYYERAEDVFDITNTSGIGLPISFDSDVPEIMEKPASGGKNYRVYVTIKDSQGFPKDPDSNTITIAKKTALGVAILPPQSMLREQQGVYYYIIPVNSTDTERVEIYYFNFAVGGNNLEYVDTSEVTRLRETVNDNLTATNNVISLANAIKAKTDSMTFDGNNINAKVIQNTDKTGYDITNTSVANIATKVWDEPKSAHTTSNTFGQFLDTTVSSREAETAAAGRFATVAKEATAAAIKAKTDQLGFNAGRVLAEATVVGDKTGYEITSANILAIASAVWNTLKSAHNVAGSFGDYLDAKVSGVESETAASARFNLMAKEATLSAVKTKTDQLVFAGGNVNANAVTVTDKLGYGLSSAERNILVDLVWDEALSGHLTAGTTGYYLSLVDAVLTAVGSISGSNPAVVAAAVWDAIRSNHVAVGSFGEALQGVLSTTRATNLDYLDVAVSTRASEANAVSRAAADISEHDATQAALAAAQADITEILTRIGIPAQTLADDIAAVASGFPPDIAADITDILNNTVATLARIGMPTTTIVAELDAILAKLGASSDLTTLITNSTGAIATSVAAIPINPLLDDDARLDNLDAPISSRATPVDITNALGGLGLDLAIADIEGVVTNELNSVDTLVGVVEEG